MTVGALVLVSVALAAGLPARDALMQEMASDTAVVESTIREVRAAVPPPSELLQAGICPDNYTFNTFTYHLLTLHKGGGDFILINSIY